MCELMGVCAHPGKSFSWRNLALLYNTCWTFTAGATIAVIALCNSIPADADIVVFLPIGAVHV